MIRKARECDFPYIYELVMMASGLVFEDALKTSDNDQIKRLMYKYFLDDNTKFSINNTYVYEVEDEIAGCMIYYDSIYEKQYNEVMESYLNNEYMFPIEAVNDSIYLDTISVFEKFRGKGISRKLIEFIIENTCKPISLIAESHKKYVIDYYKRIGFKELEEITMYNEKLKIMVFKNSM